VTPCHTTPQLSFRVSAENPRFTRLLPGNYPRPPSTTDSRRQPLPGKHIGRNTKPSTNTKPIEQTTSPLTNNKPPDQHKPVTNASHRQEPPEDRRRLTPRSSCPTVGGYNDAHKNNPHLANAPWSRWLRAGRLCRPRRPRLPGGPVVSPPHLVRGDLVTTSHHTAGHAAPLGGAAAVLPSFSLYGKHRAALAHRPRRRRHPAFWPRVPANAQAGVADVRRLFLRQAIGTPGCWNGQQHRPGPRPPCRTVECWLSPWVSTDRATYDHRGRMSDGPTSV